MREKFVLTAIYWWEIAKQAWKATWGYLGIGGSLPILIAYIILVLLLSNIIANGVLTHPFFTQLTGDLTSEIRLGIVLGFLFIVIMLVNMISAPVQRDTQQKEIIASYRSKNLQLVISTLEPTEINIDGRSVKVLNIQIVNSHKTKKLSDLRAEFVQVIQYASDPIQLQKVHLEQTGISKYAYWGEHGKAESISLVPNERVILRIAELNPRKNNLIYFNRRRFNGFFDKEVVSNVKIRFQGRLESEIEYRHYEHTERIYSNQDPPILLPYKIAKGKGTMSKSLMGVPTK